MKSTGKLIAILSVAALLVLAVGGYILLFQSDVSVERYVARGNAAMERENYVQAVRSFESARRLDSTNDPQIAISLANAYKGAENYTKAEYTLVSAIAENPEKTALYIALSRTYVEQEKFLDADELLSRAANDAVKKELESLRPAAPTLTPNGGYFSNYISVTASCPAGRIFLTTDGEYPSNENDLYTQPVALSAGETHVYAIVVDDSGLVSPAAYGLYTIAGVIEPITLTDPGLSTLLRGILGKAQEDILMTNELWGIQALEISGSVKDLSQLSHLIGLKSLKIKDLSGMDLSVLRTLPLLRTLDLSGYVLSTANLRIIGELTDLTELNLSSCALTEIKQLTNLKKLEKLDLSNNVVTDITPLTQMTSLSALSLKNNPLESLQALQGCTKLQELDLTSCKLKNLDALSGMTELTQLTLSDNDITSLEPLKLCSSLKTLDVSYNEIEDISVLPELKKLEQFDGSHNKIKEIPTFTPNGALRILNLNYNAVTSLDGLKNHTNVNYIHLDYNKVKDLTPIENCYNLVQVDVWDNPVTEKSVKALTSHSIIVNYNPNF